MTSKTARANAAAKAGQPKPLELKLDGPICIGVPSGDFVDTEFAFSLAAMVGEYKIPHVAVSARGCYVHKGRNFCVQKAKEKGCSYLLFLDSDMIFPPLTLIRLLSHQKDVVGCIYSRRVAPFSNLGTPTDRTRTKVGDQESQKNPLIEMDMLPTGVMLIKMSVFEKLERPYFFHRLVEGRDPDDDMGEDVYFCEKVKKAGIQMWADVPLSMQIKHIGQAHYTVHDDNKAAAMKLGMPLVIQNGMAVPQPEEAQDVPAAAE